MMKDTNNTRSRTRLYLGWFFILVALLLWIPSGDVIDMIIRQKDILFGRYSRGHFGVLFFLSLILLGMAALCFSRIKTVGEMIGVGVIVFLSTLASGFVLVVGSGMFNKPHYVEEQVTLANGVTLPSGVVRHGQPNEFYHLTQVDKPEQQRSYPDLPPGYPTYDLTLTIDQYGFRNKNVLDQYPILAVGDSFVAGSHVSDEQTWVYLLSQSLKKDIYNLGVSGTDPGNYLNNFVLQGRKFKPKLVLFMMYEGNDFKSVTPVVFDSTRETEPVAAKRASENVQKQNTKSFSEQISYWADASLVTKGLRRLSSEVLESIGKDRPVPGYQETVGWMPLHVQGHYYGFEPNKVLYLYTEKEAFRVSKSWQAISHIMQSMVALGEKDGYKVVFLYAPSVSHVVMPLARDSIPAHQLRNFSAYQKKDLPPADVFKKNVFDWIDNEQQVFLDECASHQWQCLSMTSALQQATARGEQVYLSYDQHMTPEGHRVVAETLAAYLKQLKAE